MKKVLIFGGTTEGRRLAEIFSQNKIYTEVHVATDYGEQVIESSEYICVKTGRLTVDDMQSLFLTSEYSVVIDATHPFAVVVSENIMKSISVKKELLLIRLEREIEEKVKNNSNYNTENCVYFESVEDCINALEKTEGNIFITTGSKELAKICKKTSIKQRLVVRVLPALESIKICYDCGLEGRQIIAMQGPFSEKMNLSQIEDYKIEILVTKESGAAGGLDAKINAAIKAGKKCFIIKRPQKEETENSSFYIKTATVKDVVLEVEKKLNRKIYIEADLHIILAGIGMGNTETMTVQVKKHIESADYVFGADRMLKCINTNAIKYDFYLAKDIIPVLEDIAEKQTSNKKVVILFSGDSGFYSGASKLYKSLKDKFKNIEILPGISSIQYLASKAGIVWQNSKILSTHGVSENKWKEKLYEYLRSSESDIQIFFITSGAKDVQRIGFELQKLNVKAKIILGYQLSYADEKVITILPSECKKIRNTGLYSGFIMVE